MAITSSLDNEHWEQAASHVHQFLHLHLEARDSKMVERTANKRLS